MTVLRRLENAEVTTDISRHAQAILNANRSKPFGTEVRFVSDGASYVGRIEQHYHPPGGALRPWGEHPGCSVFAVIPDPVHVIPDVFVGKFHFGKTSMDRLLTVDERLQRVMRRAIEITEIDFAIVCGRRTQAEQDALFRAGKSKIRHSLHLTGHAVDVAPFVGGTIVWDWPNYYKLAPFIKRAALECAVAITWGGDWKAPNTPDGPHWQIQPAPAIIGSSVGA